MNAGAAPPTRKHMAPDNASVLCDTFVITLPITSVVGIIARQGMEIRFCIIYCGISGKFSATAEREPVIPITPIIRIDIEYIPDLIFLFIVIHLN